MAKIVLQPGIRNLHGSFLYMKQYETFFLQFLKKLFFVRDKGGGVSSDTFA